MLCSFVKSVFSFLGEETGAHKTENECLWKVSDEQVTELDALPGLFHVTLPTPQEAFSQCRG